MESELLQTNRREHISHLCFHMLVNVASFIEENDVQSCHGVIFVARFCGLQERGLAFLFPLPDLKYGRQILSYRTGYVIHRTAAHTTHRTAARAKRNSHDQLFLTTHSHFSFFATVGIEYIHNTQGKP
jgi:hypothetical protein